MAKLQTRVRTQSELRDVGEDMVFAPAFFLAVIPIALGLIVVGMTALATHINENAHDATAQAFSRAQDFVNAPESPSGRQERAASLLTVYQSDIGTDLKSKDTTQADEDMLLAALQDTIQTGNRLDVPSQPFMWDSWRTLLYWSIAVVLLIWSGGTFLVYASCTIDAAEAFDFRTRTHKRFLWDLPWRRVWPVVFVALTPLGWPFYLVSAIRYSRAVKSGQDREGTLYYTDWQLHYDYLSFDEYMERHRRREADRGFIRPTTTGPERRQQDRTPDYTPYRSAEHAARSTYFKLRQEATTTSLRQRAQEADSLVERTEDTLRELGEQVRSVQTRLGTYRADQRKLADQLKTTEAQTKALSTEDLEREFDRIMAITGINGVRVVGQELCFLLEQAHIEYSGRTYDLGDWELRFGVGTSFKTCLLRDATRGGRGSLYLNGDNSFCMGTRAAEISSYLQRGQFLGAVELAVATIQSVNPSHESHIPEFYQRVKAIA